MSDKQNIEMQPINRDDLNRQEMKDAILAEESEVLIWYNDDPAVGEKTVFINIGNATMSMPEAIFYSLTKMTQVAAKKLLGID